HPVELAGGEVFVLERAGASGVLVAPLDVGGGEVPAVDGRQVGELDAFAQVESERLGVGRDLPALGKLRLQGQLLELDVGSGLEAEEAVMDEAHHAAAWGAFALIADVPFH